MSDPDASTDPSTDAIADTGGLDDSAADRAGDMGVSSERVGPTGPGQVGTDGEREMAPLDREPHDAVPPEQQAGGEEVHPHDDRAPKAGYPSTDPRSKDAPYDAPPMV